MYVSITSAGIDYVDLSPFEATYELRLISDIFCNNVPLISKSVLEPDKIINLNL